MCAVWRGEADVSADLRVAVDLEQQRGRVGLVAERHPVPAVVERLLGQPHLAVLLLRPRPRHHHLLEQRRHVQRVPFEPLREKLASCEPTSRIRTPPHVHYTRDIAQRIVSR